jgi:hypothetical protein
MDFAKRYMTDAKAEEEGRWFPFGGGSRVKVARVGTTRYNEKLREFKKPYDAVRRSQKLDDKETEEVVIKTMAAAVLLDWEGFSGAGLESLGLTMNEDKTIPYTTQNAEILLREFKDFREEIALIGADMANYKRDAQEAVAKN